MRRKTRLEDTCFELETDGAMVSSKDPGNICCFYCYGERNAGIKPRTLYILDKFFGFFFSLSYETISPNLLVLLELLTL